MTSKQASRSNYSKSKDGQHITRMHPSMKRPRAPIACFRCHHKKVRCDGVHPTCTRCLSTGVHCAYPSSRRSRNTQPTNVDPFIDSLSHLESRIRQIESDLESQRAMVHSVCAQSEKVPTEGSVPDSDNDNLSLKPENASGNHQVSDHSVGAYVNKKQGQESPPTRSAKSRRGKEPSPALDKRNIYNGIQKSTAAVSNLARQQHKLRVMKHRMEADYQEEFPHYAAPNASDIYYLNPSHSTNDYLFPYPTATTSGRPCPPSTYGYDSLGPAFEWSPMSATGPRSSAIGEVGLNQSHQFSTATALSAAEEAARLADVQQNGIAPSLLSCQGSSAAGSRYPLTPSQQDQSGLLRSPSPFDGYYGTLSHFMAGEEAIQSSPATQPTLLYHQQ